MRDTFVKTLIEIAKNDSNVHLITGDLGFGVLKPFWDQLPNQFTNAGIAEQNMASVAAGMAMEGKIVFIYSIGNFPTLRCLEQIRNDCAYHEANVKIVCVGGGFVYGAHGMSHHATEDLAIMRSLPGITILAPGDLIEAKNATEAIYNRQGTCYLRLGRGGEAQIHPDSITFSLGKAIKLLDGEEIAIFSTGGILDEVMEAQKILRNDNICPSIYSFPTLKPIDKETISRCARTNKLIVTVEEHNIIGGLGSAVCEVISELDNDKATVLRIGLQDQYSSVVGSQKYLREIYNMSANKIVEQIKNKLIR